MKIGLVISPFWYTNYPSVKIAMWKAALKGKKNETVFFDFNRKMYLDIRQPYKHAWKVYNSWYQDRDFIKNFILKNDANLNSCINDIKKSRVSALIFCIYPSTREISIALTQKIKKCSPEKVCIFCGPEISSEKKGRRIMEESFADFTVIGDRYDALVDIIEKIRKKEPAKGCPGVIYRENGHICYYNERKTRLDLESLPCFDYGSVMDSYKSEHVILPLQTSTGCVNRCVFCEPVIAEKYVTMSAPRIFREMLYQLEGHEIDHFGFTDNVLNGNMKTLFELCDLMIERRLELLANRIKKSKRLELRDILWGGHAIVRPEMTYEFLRKMKKAGCSRLVFGVESGSQKVLDLMGKRHSVDLAERVIRDTKRAGILVRSNFIIGFPGENENDFTNSLKFIKRNRKYIDDIVTFIFRIIEGTYIYDHPDEFNVQDKIHEIFWKTKDGVNNIDVRLERYNRLYDLTKGWGYSISRINKRKLLNVYKRYENETA